MTGSIAPPSPAELGEYLARIGFAGTPRPDLDTLTALHRAHVEAIAWENLDLAFGRPIGRDPRAAFDKIVRGGRGGWCFEMNGLFGWMLEAIGFRVTRVAAGVERARHGEATVGNHLLLLVELDRPYIADVGLGSGLIEPTPLVEGPIVQRFRRFALERLDGGWWRFRNHPGAMPPSFDFRAEPGDDTLFSTQCQWLQTDPASPFAGNAVAQRYRHDRLDTLINDKAMWFDVSGDAARDIGDADDYARLLRDGYGLNLPDTAALWERVSGASRDRLIRASDAHPGVAARPRSAAG